MAPVKQCLSELVKISKMKNKKQAFKKFINTCEDCLVDVISEVVLNTVQPENKFNLSKRQISSLRKHKSALKQISDESLSVPQRRQIINQSGGAFLPALLSFAIPLISSLINK